MIINIRRVAEGGGSDGEGPLPPCMVLGSTQRGEEVGMSTSEFAGGSMSMQEVSDVGGGQVAQEFVGEEENFELDSLFEWGASGGFKD